MAGNQYASPSAPFGVRNAVGGLNSSAPPTSLQDTEASDLLNIDFDVLGAFRKRGGYTQFNTTAFNSGAAFNGLYWFEKSDGNKYLLGTCGSKLGVATNLTQAATPFTDRTGALTFTAGNNNQQSFATMLDTVLGTNGVDLPWQCVGSSNAVVIAGIAGGGSAPTITKAKYVNVFSNYATLANVTESGTYHGSRVYWSTIDSISTWSASDFRDLGKNDGQVITGSVTLGGSWVIFKRHSIWIAQFTGDSDIPFVFQKSRSTVGAVSGYSIQEVENGLIFMSDDGEYYFDGNNSFKMSQRVLSNIISFNQDRFAQSTSVYYLTKNRYINAFTNGGSSTNDVCLTWDSYNNAWGLYDGINSNCFARVFNAGVEQIYFGDYSGYVYLMNNGDSDNPSGVETAIEAYYYTKWFDYGDLISKKAVPQVKVYYEFNNATLTFTYSFNFESADEYSQTFSTSGGASLFGTAIFDTDTFAGSGGGFSERHLTGRGEVIRFGYKNSTIDETFAIHATGMYPNMETNVK